MKHRHLPDGEAVLPPPTLASGSLRAPLAESPAREAENLRDQNQRLVAHFVCPACKGALGFPGVFGATFADPRVDCLSGCGEREARRVAATLPHDSNGHYPTLYQVQGRVLQFTSTVDDGFDYRWLRHPTPQATTAGVFERKTGWSRGDLAGRKVLDAGSGCGRFSRVAADMGARVYSVDGSAHGAAATATLVPEAVVAQADLLRLPFLDGTFDAAFSIGVLHHTSDPLAAFLEVARTVKPGGEVAVWLYVEPGCDEEGRVQDHQVRLAARFLHDITRACPPEALHEACERHAVSLRDVYAGRWGPLQQVLRASISPDPEECVSDTFDWHVPQYRSGHSYPEVRGWFEAAGGRATWQGDFPVSVRGTVDAGGTARPRTDVGGP